MELLAGAFIVLGVIAIVARFSSGRAGDGLELPGFIDRSVGMWAIRRLRAWVGRRPAPVRDEPTAAPRARAVNPLALPPARGTSAPWRLADPRARVGRAPSFVPFAGTPDRLTAIGARRAVPLSRVRPGPRPAPGIGPGLRTAPPPPLVLGRSSPSLGSAARPLRERPPTAWSGPRTELVPSALSARRGVDGRQVALAATVLTFGLIVLVGLAAIVGPPASTSGVLSATGRPATAPAVATPAESGRAPSASPTLLSP